MRHRLCVGLKMVVHGISIALIAESYGKWLVKTLEDERTCTKDSRRKMLKAPVICKLFLDDIRTDPDFRPKQIQEEM